MHLFAIPLAPAHRGVRVLTNESNLCRYHDPKRKVNNIAIKAKLAKEIVVAIAKSAFV
jgi:hypothetical protein